MKLFLKILFFILKWKLRTKWGYKCIAYQLPIVIQGILDELSQGMRKVM